MNLKHSLAYISKIYIILSTGLMLLTFICTGCSEEESTAPPTDSNAVSIQNNSFNPGSRTVAAGTTIKWTNNDGITHTVTSGSAGNETGVFDSGNIAPGQTYEFTFSTAGTFNYFCKIHPGMTAQVVVQ